jgi:hypothetical protein
VGRRPFDRLSHFYSIGPLSIIPEPGIFETRYGTPTALEKFI